MQLRMKLHRPHLKSSVVERPRLVEKLVAGEGGARLFIVSGSAGYGKTTIVSQWLTDKERVAWVNLDESDNDPVRFWAYVISGLQAVDASIGKGALAELKSAALSFKQAANGDSPSFLYTLLNDLDKLTDNLYIVLDDFQVIESEAILKTMAFFLGYLPLHIKLVLITRQEPRLPIGRILP